MSDYTQNTDFSAKDALLSGNPEKAISGADIDEELSRISVAIASKEEDIGTGSLGQGLGSDGTDPAWYSGGWQWVETLDLTNGGADDKTFVDFSHEFLDGYEYRVAIRNLSADTANWWPEIKFYNSTGTSVISSSTGHVSSGGIPSVTGVDNVEADFIPMMNYSGFTGMAAADVLDADFTIINAMSTAARTVVMNGSSVWRGVSICVAGTFAGTIFDTQATQLVRVGVNGSILMDFGAAYMYRRKVV